MQEKLDRVFSIYIRLKNADHTEMVECYTCGEVIPWKQAQNGHFNLRGNDATRYDERNCKPQCFQCNMFRNGMPEAFEENLRDELGEEEFEDLMRTARSIKKYTDQEYKELIRHYKLEIKKMGVIL